VNEAPAASFLGVPTEFRESVGSTNDELLRRAAAGAPEGLVLVADVQTSGRGRHGRSWWDAPGSSLLFSLLVRPSIPLPRFPLLGIAMACAVADAGSDAAGVLLGVKWPNDVLHAGRKLCGILAEARPGRAGGVPNGHFLVIGVGINVNQRAEELPAELRDRATSLRIAAGGRSLDRRTLLAAVLAGFDNYRRLALEQGAEALRTALLPRLPAPGARLVVQTADRRVEGIVEEILETGAILMRDDAGTRIPIVAGEIPLGLGASE